MSNLTIAAIIAVSMIGSYLWGYREGVKYCSRQLESVRDQLRELRDTVKGPRR